MTLRSTKAHVSQEKAVACLKWLAGEGYRWSLEETSDGIRFLHIAKVTLKKQSWRNKPGVTERRMIHNKLNSLGYTCGAFRGNALNQQPGTSYGPHVYFW
jgi:hypothetical protein